MPVVPTQTRTQNLISKGDCCSMSTRSRSLAALAIGAALGISASLASTALAERRPDDNATTTVSLPWKEARLLAEALERVHREYVDEVDDSALLESAVRGMIASLDSHS